MEISCEPMAKCSKMLRTKWPMVSRWWITSWFGNSSDTSMVHPQENHQPSEPTDGLAILHHFESMKPYESWDRHHHHWCLGWHPSKRWGSARTCGVSMAWVASLVPSCWVYSLIPKNAEHRQPWRPATAWTQAVGVKLFGSWEFGDLSFGWSLVIYVLVAESLVIYLLVGGSSVIYCDTSR